MKDFAYFVSSHGYGHASRAAAIMAAMSAKTDCRFHVFSTIPEAFFVQSGVAPATYHAMLTDIGVIQKDAFQEDLPATVRALKDFIPFSAQRLDSIGSELRSLQCKAVFADISPLGIAAAKHCGIPAVLIENFRWDWIYSGYVSLEPKLKPFVESLQAILSSSDLVIQTDPVCWPDPEVNLHVGTISRVVRQSKEDVRKALGFSIDKPLITMSLGVAEISCVDLQAISKRNDLNFAVMGAPISEPRSNLKFVPRESSILHPDLINASSLVVGKLGYSTLAEVYQAACRYLYIGREHSPETPILAAFVNKCMTGAALSYGALSTGSWLDDVDRLLAKPLNKSASSPENNAIRVAEYLLRTL